MRPIVLIGSIAVLIATTTLALARDSEPAASAGPGRIECRSATACVLGIGSPAKLKYRINVEGLPAADKERLAKQCAAGGKTPCIVTVNGTEMGDPGKIKAAGIKWYN